jgi:hypothetical protein
VQTAALIVVIAAGLWLGGVGVLMAARPPCCLRLLERMTGSLGTGSWRLNLTEQGLRILVGAALIVLAPASKLPLLFEVAGWVLAATSVLILLLPMRWHAAYGRMLLRRLTPTTVRVASPVPVLAGAGLLYAAL